MFSSEFLEHLKTAEGQTVVKVLEDDELMIQIEKEMDEAINTLADTIANHIQRAYTLLDEVTAKNPSEDEGKLIKFRMIHGIVSALPERLGPIIAAKIFPEGWQSVAALALVKEMFDMIIRGDKPEEEDKPLVH